MTNEERDIALRNPDVHFAWLLGQHIHGIAREKITPEHTRDKPCVLCFSPVPGSARLFVVKLWHRGGHLDEDMNDPVWDQGTINDIECGNRCGVIQTFAILAAQHRAEIMRGD